MKFFGTIVAVTALFASSISASPLGDLGGIYPRAPADYNINKVLKDWMNGDNTKRRLANHCNTKGGWEGWAQGKIKSEFRDTFRIPQTIREKSDVYQGNKKRADLVLPKTDKLKGMIIELKCENAYGQKGVKIKAPVHADIAKQVAVKPEYKDHTFVALVMAYTKEVDQSLRRIGMKPILGAEADVSGPQTVKIYREDYKLKSLLDEIEDLEEAMYNLFLSKSRPGSPSGTRPSSSNPAPGKAAPSKARPGKTTPK